MIRSLGFGSGNIDILSSFLEKRGKYFFTSDCNGCVRVWNIHSGKRILKKKENLESEIWAIADIKNKPNHFIGASGKILKIWNWKVNVNHNDVEKMMITVEKDFPEHHSSEVYTIAFLSENILVSSGKDKKIVIWDINKCVAIREIENVHRDSTLAILPINKDRFWTGGMDRTIKLWDSKGKNHLLIKANHSIRCLTKSFDKRYIISGSFFHSEKKKFSDTIIVIYDEQSGKELFVIDDHNGGVEDLKLLTNGNFVSVSKDETVKLFHHKTFECLRTIRSPSNRGKVKSWIRSCAVLNSNETDIMFTEHSPHILSFRSEDELIEWNERYKFILENGNYDFAIEINNQKIEIFKFLISNVCNLSVKTLNCIEIDIKEKEKLNVSFGEILKLLMGEKYFVNNTDLYDYFLLFRELKMKDHCYLICKMLKDRVFDIDLLKKLFEISTNGNYEPNNIEKCPFSLQTFKMLRNFFEINKKKKVENYFERNSIIVLLKNGFENESINLKEHSYFSYVIGGMDSSPYSFEIIAQKNLEFLMDSKETSNIVLKTRDGGVFKSHIEILVLKSNFFYRNLKFPGIESKSLKEKNEIIVEELSTVELKLLLEFFYRGYFSADFSVIIKLLNFAEKHFEIDLREYLREKIKRISKKKFREGNFISFLCNIGHLLERKIVNYFINFWGEFENVTKGQVLLAINGSKRDKKFEKFQEDHYKFQNDHYKFMEEQRMFMKSMEKHVHNNNKMDVSNDNDHGKLEKLESQFDLLREEIIELKKEIMDLRGTISKKREREEFEEQDNIQIEEGSFKKRKKS